MITLGSLKLGSGPKIAAVFDDRVTPPAALSARKHGVSIAEMRIDLYSRFDHGYVLGQIKKFKTFSKIATIRSKAEGGRWKFSDAERLSLFKAVIPEVDAVDIELSSEKILNPVTQAAHAERKKVIASYHNFEMTPKVHELIRLIHKAKSAGADIVKIAALARNAGDVQRLALVTIQAAPENVITIAMGEKGKISRILFPALGSLFTYASIGKSVAPGQLGTKETARLLKLFYRV